MLDRLMAPVVPLLLFATASALHVPAARLTRRTLISVAGGAVLNANPAVADEAMAAAPYRFARTNPVWTPEREEIKGSQRTYNPKFVACMRPHACAACQLLIFRSDSW